MAVASGIFNTENGDHLLEDGDFAVHKRLNDQRVWGSGILPAPVVVVCPGDSGGRKRDGCHGQYHHCADWRPR